MCVCRSMIWMKIYLMDYGDNVTLLRFVNESDLNIKNVFFSKLVWNRCAKMVVCVCVYVCLVCLWQSCHLFVLSVFTFVFFGGFACRKKE